MFLCRAGGKAWAASSCRVYRFAASLRLAADKAQDAARPLRPSGFVSRCGPSAHRGRLAGQHSGVFPGKRAPHAWTTCRSLSGLGSLLPSSCSSRNRFNPRESFRYPAPEPWIRNSSSSKLLSSALSRDSNQKPQGTWRDPETSTEIRKMHFSQVPQEGDEKPEPEKKLNKAQQLKKVFQEYGAVGVLFHIGISIVSLGIFYTAASSGINMTAVLCKLGFSECVVQSKMAAGTSTFLIAYAVHKLFAPFRISITLVSVPFIVRYLRKTGLFKSSPPPL